MVCCSTTDLASRHVGARQNNTPLGVPTFEPNRKDLQIQKIRLASKSREPRSVVRGCGASRALVAPYSFYCRHARAHDPHGATGPADMGTVSHSVNVARCSRLPLPLHSFSELGLFEEFWSEQSAW